MNGSDLEININKMNKKCTKIGVKLVINFGETIIEQARVPIYVLDNFVRLDKKAKRPNATNHSVKRRVT